VVTNAVMRFTSAPAYVCLGSIRVMTLSSFRCEQSIQRKNENTVFLLNACVT